MASIAGYVAVGLAAGLLSGLVGIGCGMLIVPALVFLYGFSQHQAQGTTLAQLVPPIGLMAAWAYYRQGFVDIRIAVFIAAGFVVGSYLGAQYAIRLPNEVLSSTFGVVLMAIGLKMIIGK